MSHLLPVVFIVLGALALVATLYFFWQSLRGALVQDAGAALGASGVSSSRAALLAEKQTLLLALRDLDAEREAGKLSDDDYTELSARYRGRTREVLRKLDEQLAPHRQAARDLITAARGGVAPKTTEASQSQPAITAEAVRRTCACGIDNEPDAVFCKKCGARLTQEQGA